MSPGSYQGTICLFSRFIFANDYILRVDPLVQANDAGKLVARALPYSAAWRERDGGRVGEEPDNELNDAGCYTYHFLPL